MNIVPDVLQKRYQNLRELENGPFITIYSAEVNDKGSQSYLTIRMLHSPDSDYVKDFEQTVSDLKTLQSPQIAWVNESGEAAGVAFAICEYVEGIRLDSLLEKRGKPFTPQEAFSVALDILKALKTAHEKQVYWLKIKPSNLIITPQNELKIVDVGIDRPHFNQAKLDSAVLDTVYYESAEEAAGDVPTESSNLYSLGVVLYEMLSGRPPFVAATTFDLKQMHCEQTPVSLPDVDPKARRFKADQIVQKALAKEPTKRYQNIAEMTQDIQRYLAKNGGVLPLGVVVSPPPPLPPEPTFKEKSILWAGKSTTFVKGLWAEKTKRLWLIAVPILAVVLLGILLFTLSIKPSDGKGPLGVAGSITVTTTPLVSPLPTARTAAPTQRIAAPITTPAATTVAPTATATPDLFASLLKQIEDAKQAGNFELAAQLVDKLKDIQNPPKPDEVRSQAVDVYCRYGDDQARNADIGKGIEYLQKCLSEGPSDDYQALLERANLYREGATIFAKDKNWGAAVPTLEKLYGLDKGFRDIRDILLDAYFQFAGILDSNNDKATAQDLICNRARAMDLSDDKKAAVEARCKELTPPTATIRINTPPPAGGSGPINTPTPVRPTPPPQPPTPVPVNNTPTPVRPTPVPPTVCIIIKGVTTCR